MLSCSTFDILQYPNISEDQKNNFKRQRSNIVTNIPRLRAFAKYAASLWPPPNMEITMKAIAKHVHKSSQIFINNAKLERIELHTPENYQAPEDDIKYFRLDEFVQSVMYQLDEHGIKVHNDLKNIQQVYQTETFSKELKDKLREARDHIESLISIGLRFYSNIQISGRL